MGNLNVNAPGLNIIFPTVASGATFVEIFRVDYFLIRDDNSLDIRNLGNNLESFISKLICYEYSFDSLLYLTNKAHVSFVQHSGYILQYPVERKLQNETPQHQSRAFVLHY